MAIVFCGNGINLMEKRTPSWGTLLRDISADYGISQVDSLSMTLGYEEFEAKIMNRQPDVRPVDIKRKIAESLDMKTKTVDARNKKSVYRRLFDLGIREFITTNYDYSIERTAVPDFVHKYTTREQLYSKYRKQKADYIVVHHVHGECAYPSSICLGYEHYAGTLEKIRSFLTESTSTKDKNDPHKFRLYDVLVGLEKAEDSWLYRFFTEDIYFLGFGLDVSELDLWWLITYRAKLIRENKIPIHNQIVYYETGIGRNQSEQKRIKDKENLLRSFGVEVVSCMDRGYPGRYEHALSDMKVRIGARANAKITQISAE